MGRGENGRMWIAWIELDLLLGDVHTLTEKRSVVRPIVAEVRRRFDVSVAEGGEHDLYRRARIGAGIVSGDRAHALEVLDGVERLVAGRPEVDLLSARRRDLHSED